MVILRKEIDFWWKYKINGFCESLLIFRYFYYIFVYDLFDFGIIIYNCSFFFICNYNVLLVVGFGQEFVV